MSYLEDLHRAHVDRQRKFFPPQAKPVAPPQESPSAEIIDLKLERLIREAQNIEQTLMQHNALSRLADPLGHQSVRAIQKIVADFYGLRFNQMTSDERRHSVTGPRQVAMYLAHRFTKYGWVDLGRRFGGRDHSTIMHGVQRVESKMRADHRLRDEIQLLIMKMIDQTGLTMEEAHAQN